MPSKEVSSDPLVLIPESEIEIEPNWLVRVIVSAKAAIGKAKASNAKTSTRLIFVPSKILFLFPDSP